MHELPLSRRRWMAGYLVAMAALVGVVAAIGVVGRGDGTTATVVSLRGETYELVTSGIYTWSSQRMVAEGVGWDVVTLLLAVPALLVASRGVLRGSLRWRLVAVGLLAYVWYQYLMYAMAWAIGPLFLPFVVIFAASAAGIAWLVASIDVGTLTRHVSDGFPRRSMVAFCGFIVLLLLGMWLPLIAAVLRGEYDGALNGQTTLVVQGLDLGVVVPIAIATAVLLVRRSAAGLLLATALAVKGLAMAVAIFAMLVSAWLVEGTPELVPMVLFAAVAMACLALIVAMLRAIEETPVTDAAAAWSEGPSRQAERRSADERLTRA
jgi:hypothetical protein